MKKVNLMTLVKVLGLFMLTISLFTFTSCKDDEEDDDDTTIILDGMYISGGATAYADLNSKAMMKVTKNEIDQADRATLYELYIPLKAGTAGFTITKVAGSTKTTYAPGTDWGVVAQGTTDEPKVAFQRGGVVAGSTKFTVPADGFYHVVIDMEVMKAVIVPVHWGMIGAACDNGWGSSVALTESAFNTTTMSWTKTNMTLKKGDWKFRYSDGWKVEIDTVLDLGGGKIGVKANTNFGGAVDALVAGGANIANNTPGIYTCSISYTLGTGYVATITKTGDIPPTDYSAYNMGLVGNGVYNGANVHDWNSTILKHVPVKNGNVYTWTFNDVKVTTAGSFKIRQGDDWTGLIVGYTQVTMAGTDAADFETNGDGNFVPKVNDAIYDMVLTIDAASETYTFTVTKN